MNSYFCPFSLSLILGSQNLPMWLDFGVIWKVIELHFQWVQVGVPIHVGGSGSCHVKIRVYDYMTQPKPDTFINCVKAGQPALTQSMFTINLNPLISCRVCRLCSNSCWQVGSCCVKLRVYYHMAQPKPNPFINLVKVVWPILTWNMFTVNPNWLISCWVHVKFTGHVKHCHP